MSDVVIFAVGSLVSSMVALALLQIGRIESRVQAKNRPLDGLRPQVEPKAGAKRKAA